MSDIAIWGNLAVVAVTVAIFFGTLSLGRTRAAARSATHSTAEE